MIRPYSKIIYIETLLYSDAIFMVQLFILYCFPETQGALCGLTALDTSSFLCSGNFFTSFCVNTPTETSWTVTLFLRKVTCCGNKVEYWNSFLITCKKFSCRTLNNIFWRFFKLHCQVPVFRNSTLFKCPISINHRQWLYFNVTNQYFIGINFRDFANFFGIRESLYPRNRFFSATRES